jgi:hypothetical protein
MEQNGKTDRNLWNKSNVHGCFSIFSLISLIIFYGMELNGMDKPIDIFGIKQCSWVFLNLLLKSAQLFSTEQNRMEWKGKTYIHHWNKNNVHGCISIFSLICLIIFYGTEQNGTERPIDIFGIKTIFSVVSQSLA